jgi:hypothetical protein
MSETVASLKLELDQLDERFNIDFAKFNKKYNDCQKQLIDLKKRPQPGPGVPEDTERTEYLERNLNCALRTLSAALTYSSGVMTSDQYANMPGVINNTNNDPELTTSVKDIIARIKPPPPPEGGAFGRRRYYYR